MPIGNPIETVTRTEMVIMVTVTILTSHRPISPMKTSEAAQNNDSLRPPVQWVAKKTPSTITGHGSHRKNRSVCFRPYRMPSLSGLRMKRKVSGNQSAKASTGSRTGCTRTLGKVL